MSHVITYAQNREDLYIASFFPDIEKGFYIDIGAFHPEKDSVTKFFYERGWSGVNIEPQPSYFKKFMTHRRRDINLNLGISNKADKLKLREYAGGGFSTFSEEIKDEYSERKEMSKVAYHDYDVDVVTLGDIFREHANEKKVHFLKIDVEGLEYEVIESNDWTLHRPEMVCIEANHIIKNWKPLLKKAKYTKVFFDGLNEYYLADESLYRRDLFCYAEKFLGWGVVVPNDLYVERETLKREIKGLYEKQKNDIETMTKLAKNLDNSESALRRMTTIKGAVRNLAAAIKRRVERI